MKAALVPVVVKAALLAKELVMDMLGKTSRRMVKERRQLQERQLNTS
jgi:hypothetical protein